LMERVRQELKHELKQVMAKITYSERFWHFQCHQFS
jgi:hypothetical protein